MEYTPDPMKYLAWLLLASPIFGAYVGNPASPAIMNMGIFSGPSPYFKFTSGYIADYTSNKRFQASKSNNPLARGQSFHEFGIHSQMATASAIFVERLEVFGAAGGSKEHATWDRDLTYKDYSIILKDFDSTYTFSWATGCKVILVQWWQTYLGADFTYFSVPADHQTYFRFLNRLNLPIEPEKQTFSLDEWQISLGLSSRLWIFTPYGGATYLNSKLKVHSSRYSPELFYENAQNFGYFYGMTVSLTGRFHVNLERRVSDEFAYSIGAIAVF